jgi:hypothetical protein
MTRRLRELHLQLVLTDPTVASLRELLEDLWGLL